MQQKLFSLALPAALSAALLAGCAATGPQDAGADPRFGAVSAQPLPFLYGRRLDSRAFTGAAYRSDIIDTDALYKFPQTNVITFEAGARSSWHRHGGMDILVTAGEGILQIEGQPAQLLKKGDVASIPAGVRHWHGAAPGSYFQQIVIYDKSWKPSAAVKDGDNRVSDAFYKALKTVSAASPKGRRDLSTFAVEDEVRNLPTFTGPVRLGKVLDKKNASGAEMIANVVFEPGSYNAWHEHEGGQILIVTDGVGFHQRAGEPVQVLYPGDVVKCPPGVRHWHGAAPGSRFAHLAVSPSPKKKRVQWYQPISREEYLAIPVPGRN